ncbi:MAG: twin-arginine translocation signal domain-containing protein, partial [Pseudomonadota bacterium]
MDRRKFLTGSGLGAAALVAGCDCAEKCGVAAAGPVGAARQRELKMVTSWPKNFPGLGDAAEETARRIEAVSGGAI